MTPEKRQWVAIGGGVAAAAAAVSLGVVLWRRSRAGDAETAATAAAGGGDEMDAAQMALVKELSAQVELLAEGKELDRKAELALLKKLQRLGESIHAQHPATRVLVAQYCLHAYQAHVKGAADKLAVASSHTDASPAGIALEKSASVDRPSDVQAQLDEFKNLQSSLRATYLDSAWDILDQLNANPPEELSESTELTSKLYSTQLDIAFMLQDSEKINSWYDKAAAVLEQRLDEADSREILMAFLAAAACGRLKQICTLGERLRKNELEGVHAGALQDPTRVDYNAVYMLALQLSASTGRGSPSWPDFSRELTWKALRVKSARFRPQVAATAEAAILRPNLKAGRFVSVDVHPGTHLVCSGAVAHCVNPGPVPLPLSGFCSRGDVLLFGFFDIVQGKEAIRVTNFLTLKRDASSRNGKWVGKELCSMIAIAGPRAGSKLSTVVLDAELLLEEDPSASYKCL